MNYGIFALALAASAGIFILIAKRRESKRTLPESIVYALHVIARWFVCFADAADYGLQAFRRRKMQSGIVLECSEWGLRESQKEAA